MQTTITLHTSGPGLHEITPQVVAWVAASGITAGLLTLFVCHTSASLLIQENVDSGVQADLETFLHRLVPRADDPASGWITHRAEGPDDMPAHIKAALLPVSLGVPVDGGRPVLGTWQGIYLWEHRSRPHTRTVVTHLA